MNTPTFTILIPTYNHADTLWYALQSVLHQTRQDFEIFVIGDGVPDRTRDILAAMIEQDNRIRFFDNPKGEHQGELFRHDALQLASGKYVCYQADDDLWFPNHLETLARMLENHDLVHTMQIEVAPDGQLSSWMFDAGFGPEQLERMRRSETGFGLANGAHTLAAYKQLPTGWHPASFKINSDLYFWLQFLEQPGCRYCATQWPTSCHLSSTTRRHWNNAQRVAELAHWWPRIVDARQRSKIIMTAMLPLVTHHYTQSYLGQNSVIQIQHLHENIHAISSTNQQMESQITKLETQNIMLSEINQQLEKQLAAVYQSNSWRITSLLRGLSNLLRINKFRQQQITE